MRLTHVFIATLAAASLTLAASAANRERVDQAKAKAAHAAHAATRPHEVGGALPGPVALKIEKQNSPQDKLLVEFTYAIPENNGYVCYGKVVWGDLGNLIKGVGRQYYSKWDGGLELTTGFAKVDYKIQFDDGGGHKLVAWTPPAATSTRPGRTPGEGSGADLLINAEGTKIEWKAGVVGVLDGLRFKITSAKPAVTGTLKAGNFTVPLAIGPAPATAGPTRATRK